LRQETAAQKRALDRSLTELNATKAALKVLEKRTAAALAAQKRAGAAIAKNKDAARRALARSAAAQKKLQVQIAAIIRKQMEGGNIPSAYNGTLSWPMSGDVSQNFGCTGFSWEPPLGSCEHFHRGIDIVAPSGTAVKASGAGTVVYIGWNYADGADPAWIVIIAHSEPPDVVRPHAAALSGRIRAGSPSSEARSRLRGNTGHYRRPPPLGGHVPRGLRESSPVPVSGPPPRVHGPLTGRSTSGRRRRASIGQVKRTMAVILAGGEGERLSILSQERAKPAVPFGGKYRIIDFTLSNCVNSTSTTSSS
jgi:hypothetical protein